MATSQNKQKFIEWYVKYIKICNINNNVNINDLQDKICQQEKVLQQLIDYRMSIITTANDNIDIKIAQITDNITDLKEKILHIKNMQKRINAQKAVIEAKNVYNKLINHIKIQKIEITENILHIITKKLTVNNANIGYYDLQINPESVNLLRIQNLEKIVMLNFDHWCISHAKPCLAEWAFVLQKYLYTFQIFLYVDALIHFLLSTKASFPHMHVDDWLQRFNSPNDVSSKHKVSASNSINTSTSTSCSASTAFTW